MKIGILNLQYTRFNYGAVLQAAALEDFIRKNVACEVEHINYIPPKAPQPKISLMTRLRWKGIGLLRRLSIIKETRPQVCVMAVKNAEVFEIFRQEWLTRTKALCGLSELEEASKHYDAVVVGSDQVWRLAYTSHTFPAFFLSFLPDRCRRIAYAASFGTDQWEGDDVVTAVAAACLKKFRAVSVREKSGMDICRDKFGIAATHVLDPALLVGRSFFDSIIDKADPEIKASDFVYYKLRGGMCGFNDVQKLIAGLGHSIEDIYYGSATSSSGETTHYYHPVASWLGKLRACKKMLVTDSFHGICFAILFEKDFIWIPNPGAGTSRLESLLGLLGLEDRKCTNFAKMQRMVKSESRIDYVQVNAQLATLRNDSERFLLSALKKQGIYENSVCNDG